MKPIILLLFLGISTILSGQKIDYNTKKGFVAEGYDVVSYFVDKKPLEGNNKYQTNYDGAKFRFSSEKNLKMFIKNPKSYVPQYGGYCAYAVAEKNIKMQIDGDAYEIRDGKLYLFYNSFFSNKLEDWKEGDTKKLKIKADKNWVNLKHKEN